MKNKKEVGKALGLVASGLFIVTARHEKEEDAVLASWVNQCSFAPPALTMVLAKTRPARLLVEASERFTVNVLEKDGVMMKKFFAPNKKDVFEGLKTKKSSKKPRILSEAVSWLECKVISSTPVGDHVVYVGEIVDGGVLKGGTPYTHVRKNGFSY